MQVVFGALNELLRSAEVASGACGCVSLMQQYKNPLNQLKPKVFFHPKSSRAIPQNSGPAGYSRLFPITRVGLESLKFLRSEVLALC